MATPSSIEKQKVEAKLQGFLKKLNPDGSPKKVFDENKAKELMRSAVRDKWMYCPTKLAFLLKSRIPDMDNSTRTKWLQKCAKCGGHFKEVDINVDHIEGEISFTEWSDAEHYAASILNVKFSELQILCIPDHKTKSRAEALGLDWRTEEGWDTTLAEQAITRINELKATPQKQWLQSKGLVPGPNLEQRKKQIRTLLQYKSSSNQE